MAALDLLTSDEVVDALRGIDLEVEYVGALYMSAISQQIDDICGPVVARPVVEVHDGGSRVLVLNHRPFGALTSVTMRYGYGTQTVVVPISDLIVEASGIVDHLTLGFYLGGPRSVTVAYNAGRCATTETVPERFKLACTLLLQGAFRAAETAGPEGYVSARPMATEDDIRRFLGSEVRIPSVA